MVARGLGKLGNREKLLNGCGVLFWSDGNVLEPATGGVGIML